MDQVQLDEVQWSSPEWVQMFGLRTDNVLEYFALSPFYDRSTNNEVLKMQSNFNEQLQSRRNNLHEELKNMKGMEYEVSTSEQDFWVIKKQDRQNSTIANVVAVYFVVGQNIYQSPSVYNVLISRLLATSKYLKTAQEIAQSMPRFTSSGYVYDINDANDPKEKPSEKTESCDNPFDDNDGSESNEMHTLPDRNKHILNQLLSKPFTSNQRATSK
ncbi:mediator complex subunit [Starmerella bacillaris]|uniref:Mediator of RNA polymerase II transcription subunit 6 n=1 Tax=Starmerella bacillaris TaxID=1247836 RepID=A0AAV5RDT7_STABA|nr:mediator complex subunit [Starmerella bacillaris]